MIGLDAENINMASIGTPTFFTVQDLQNLFHSVGWIAGGVVTDAGSGNVNVASGNGIMRATDSRVTTILFFDWSAASNQSTTTDEINYVGIQYNSGSPNIFITTNYGDFDFQTNFPIASVANEGGILHILNDQHAVGDHANFMVQRMYATVPIIRDNRLGGIILGETGTRNITLSAGVFWSRLNVHVITAKDTSVSGGFDVYASTTRVAISTKTWDNDSYGVGHATVSLDANKYGVLWFYQELDDDLVMVYGTSQHNKSAEAETQKAPASIPNRLIAEGKLIARLIFKKGENTARAIESVFDTFFEGTLVSDHGNLAGLSDAIDHNYALLINGTRPLTADWSTGGFDVFVGSITGHGGGLTNVDAELLNGKDIGTSGNTIPLLDGSNTWSAKNTHTGESVWQDNINIELGTGAQGNGDARFYHDGTDVILDLNSGPSKIFDRFRVKRDIVMSAEIEGTRHSLIFTHATGANLASGQSLFLKFGEVQTSDAKAPAMPRSGSIVSVSIQYDIIGTDGGLDITLGVVRNGSPTWLNTISDTVASDKEDSFTQARNVNTFSAEGNLTIEINCQGLGMGSIDINDVMVILEVYYNN